MTRIERVTSPLPRECSTTEPHGRIRRARPTNLKICTVYWIYTAWALFLTTTGTALLRLHIYIKLRAV